MKPTKEEYKKLWAVFEDFINKQDIHCAETIYQCDWVIENAYELIEKCCDIVGYKKFEEDDK